ncbi:MAG: transcriptional repressor [Dermatophilaceae bacterium]|nr:transcriptional repressor [Dermatophilaceae bacterium]MBP9919267.1 transcriptional repressor [Dermatophilaceae bacterium]
MTARKLTRQQATVLAGLQRSEDFTSAQQLHTRLRAEGATVGLATVYRTLAALAATGEIDVLRTDEGEAVYRHCSTDDHHHHLLCRHCGRTVEVDGPAVESWAARVSAEHGFREVRHTVELVGVCASC